MNFFIMRYLLSCFFLVLCAILSSNNLSAQSETAVTDLNISLEDENLVIDYAITHFQKGEIFIVWLEVTDSSGNLIPANSLTGDIGDEISGGKKKQIIWDLAADSILLSENIFIEVKAEQVHIPVKEELAEENMAVKESPEENKEETAELITVVEDTPVDNSEETVEEPLKVEDTGADQKDEPVEEAIAGEEFSEDQEDNEIKESTTVKPLMLISRSLIYPGWGSAKFSNRKLYLLMGAGGYGCIAASWYFNVKAVEYYGTYTDDQYATAEESDKQYAQAIKYANYSRIFIYSGLAIWVTDLVLVGIRSINNAPKKDLSADRIRIKSYYDPYGNMPVIGLCYNF